MIVAVRPLKQISIVIFLFLSLLFVFLLKLLNCLLAHDLARFAVPDLHPLILGRLDRLLRWTPLGLLGLFQMRCGNRPCWKRPV